MSRTRQIVPTAFLAVSLLAGAVRAEDEAAAPSLDPKAVEIVSQCGAYLKGLNSFSLEVKSETRIEAEGMKQIFDSVTSIAVERPNKVASITKSGFMGATLISDGETLYQAFPMLKSYTKKDAPETLEDLPADGGPGGMMNAFPVLDTLVASDPAESMMEGVMGASYAGTETIDGVECHHLKFVQEEFDWEAWISTGEMPLLRKLVPDMGKMFEAMGAEMPGGMGAMKMSAILELKDWAANPDLPAETFVFTPSEGMEEEDDLFGEGELEEVEEAEPASLLGAAAPAFELDLLGGGKASLAAHKDKDIVILDFWATWCGPCRRGLPIVAKVAAEHADKHVVFYAVNLRESKEKIQGFLDKAELKIAVALDQGDVAQEFGVSGIPHTVIIGKDGTVQSVHVGFSPAMGEELTEELESLIAGRKLTGE